MMENFLALYFSAILPGIVILSLACIVLLLTAFFKRKADAWVYYITQVGLVLSAALIVNQVFSIPHAVAIAQQRFRIDQLSILGGLLVLALSIFTFFYARQELVRMKLPSAEYFALCLFSILGMLVMTTADHFLLLYVALELMSFPLYVLCAYYRTSSHGAEAGLKYFFTGALASGLLLYGISLVYGVVHSFSFASIGMIATHISTSEMTMLLVAIGFILAGLAFKLGLAPFHMWLPDVYAGAPPSVTLFLSGAPKIAVFILLVRLLQTSFVPLFEHWSQVLYFLAVLSIVIGNIAALTQNNLRRMLAYSSIAHMGFMLMGLAVGGMLGLSAALFYIISYVIVSAGAFAIITLLHHQGYQLETVDDLSGFSRRHPWLAGMLLLLIFSMAGIPPTLGFIAKLSILFALVETQQILLAVFVVLMSVVGLYYYLRMIKVMYFNDQPANERLVASGSTVLVSIVGVLTLFLGIFPALLLQLCHAVLASSLF
jgi:NADH-quinone oxidoreductase subunit N